MERERSHRASGGVRRECDVLAGGLGKNKFDVRWEDGIWLGIEMESGESIIGKARGVAKARDL